MGSYLDAKHNNGIWLVRIEDIDTPRCVPGAADDILRTLEIFGLHSDEPVIYQSQRTSAYEESLQRLKDLGSAYRCGCTRKEIADSALHGIEGPVYPGTCRNGIPAGRNGRAWRVLTDNHETGFDDALQGHMAQHLETEIGDFVVKRADNLFAYQFAVVVDDAYQGITHVVRGADLLASTPRQIHLQRLLGFSTPAYMHLPVAVNGHGEKLSKQTLAAPVKINNTCAMLYRVLLFLGQQPPAKVREGSTKELLDWAVNHWNPAATRNIRKIAI